MFYDEGLGALFDNSYSLGPCVLKPPAAGSSRSAAPALMQSSAFCTTTRNRRGQEGDREGMRIAIRIVEQEALRAVERGPHVIPASDSDADIWDFVKQRCHTLYHPTRTCAIGRVVDNELRVLGCDALRVVDASVMPSVVRGNTNAPTIMIAERAADIVGNA